METHSVLSPVVLFVAAVFALSMKLSPSMKLQKCNQSVKLSDSNLLLAEVTEHGRWQKPRKAQKKPGRRLNKFLEWKRKVSCGLTVTDEIFNQLDKVSEKEKRKIKPQKT